MDSRDRADLDLQLALRCGQMGIVEGSARWKYDPRARAWYFALAERAEPPYLRQIVVEAILDMDSEGRLAGVEILGGPKLLIDPPTRALEQQGSSDA